MGKAEGLEEGRSEGLIEGERRALFEVLQARGLEATEDQRACIADCTDLKATQGLGQERGHRSSYE